MADFYITHTRKDGADDDRRIDALQITGKVYPIDTVIGWVNGGEHRFYVSVQGRTVRVVALIHHSSRRWYLTTEGDGFPPNNLLALPDC